MYIILSGEEGGREDRSEAWGAGEGKHEAEAAEKSLKWEGHKLFHGYSSQTSCWKKHYKAKAAVFSERSITQSKWRGRQLRKICLVFFSHPRCESQTYDDLNIAQESEVSDKRSLSLVNYLTKTTTPGWKINGLKFYWNECVRNTTNHSSPSLRTKRRMSCLIGKLLVHIEFNHIPGV